MQLIYRRVRVILLNATNEALTVEGAEVLVGAWSAGRAVSHGETVARQSARTFGTESSTLGRGTEAFVRFGSATGYFQLHWHLPWVGDIRCDPVHDDVARRITVYTNDDDPADVAVLITLPPHRDPLR